MPGLWVFFKSARRGRFAVHFATLNKPRPQFITTVGHEHRHYIKKTNRTQVSILSRPLIPPNDVQPSDDGQRLWCAIVTQTVDTNSFGALPLLFGAGVGTKRCPVWQLVGCPGPPSHWCTHLSRRT